MYTLLLLGGGAPVQGKVRRQNSTQKKAKTSIGLGFQ
jgi:hypothetical protein